MEEYDIDVHFFKVSDLFSGQRIDNFLKIYLKLVPKSMIYRIIRTGKVRVNTKKVQFYYKLQVGDVLEIPPIKKVKIKSVSVFSKNKMLILQKSVIYEDDYILILNKPAGIAVHDGSGLDFNVIDGLRSLLNTKNQFLELVHRLDRDTSGILLLAKNRMALTYLQEQWKLKIIKKEYLALVCGLWNINTTSVTIPIYRKQSFNYRNTVYIDAVNSKKEKVAKTDFQVKEFFGNLASFLVINPITGRTHQIRMHAKSLNHPVIGDKIYGNYQINTNFRKLGLNRLFLHASKLSFLHPNTKQKISINAPIDQSFYQCLFFLKNIKYYFNTIEN